MRRGERKHRLGVENKNALCTCITSRSAQIDRRSGRKWARLILEVHQYSKVFTATKLERNKCNCLPPSYGSLPETNNDQFQYCNRFSLCYDVGHSLDMVRKRSVHSPCGRPTKTPKECLITILDELKNIHSVMNAVNFNAENCLRQFSALTFTSTT